MSQQQDAPRNVPILEEMDRKLSALPLTQQTLVAFYAHGLRDGLRLREEPAHGCAPGKERREPPGTMP
jgi:hypothetical protein